MKVQPPAECGIHFMLGNESWRPEDQRTPLRHHWEAWHGELYRNRPSNHMCGIFTAHFPYGVPGDRLWVKETFWHQPEQHDSYPGMGSLKVCDEVTIYRADSEGDEDRNFAWRPSIFMPRALSRLTLEITDVRVQRLQEISGPDAEAEGIVLPKTMSRLDREADGREGASFRHCFRELWDSINAKRGHGWETNDWVWALTFRRVA